MPTQGIPADRVVLVSTETALYKDSPIPKRNEWPCSSFMSIQLIIKGTSWAYLVSRKECEEKDINPDHPFESMIEAMLETV